MKESATVETTYTSDTHKDMKAIVTERDGQVSDVMIYINEGQHFLIDTGDLEGITATSIVCILAGFMIDVVDAHEPKRG